MPNLPQNALPWHRREDTWAIFISLGLGLAVSGAFFLGASRAVGATALAIPTWSGGLGAIAAALRAQPAAGFFAASVLVTVILASVDARIGTRFSREAIGPLKTLRGWAFTWTFLSIGFTTRSRELTPFGWKPFAAFALGVLVNVPLGYWLSTRVFAGYWLAVK